AQRIRLAPGVAFDRIAGNLTIEAPPIDRVVVVYQYERDRIAVQPRTDHDHLFARAPCDDIDLLVLLRDVQLVLLGAALGADLELPQPAHLRGDNPEVDLAARPAHARLEVGLPVAHIEIVRHDARTGLQFGKQAGTQREVDARQQVHGKDRCLADPGVEQVALVELRALGDARFPGIRGALLHALRIEVHTEPARAVF